MMRRFTIGGMSLVPASVIEQLGAIDQRQAILFALPQIAPVAAFLSAVEAVARVESRLRASALGVLHEHRPATDAALIRLGELPTAA